MFCRQIQEEEGLLLEQSRENRLEAAIHMLFMWMDLAVIWANQRYEVVDVQYARRWRLAYIPQRPACYVLEVAATHFSDFQVGDQLSFEALSPVE